MSEAPVDIEIQDRGDHRHVITKGPHYVAGQLVTHSEFDTLYSADLLRKLVVAKGAYLHDEVQRLTNPDYIRRPILKALERFGVDLHGKRVLDPGCGPGSSSIILAEAGAAEVVGVDVVAGYLDVARHRVAEHNLADRVRFHLLEHPPHLPFPDASLDVVFANALLEHIPPQQRAPHLQEWWRLLKPGGYLLLRETPNRLWPRDGHTTGLWLVPYMPLRLARWVAVRFSDRVGPGDSIEDLIVAGIRGATYWEVLRALPKGEVEELNLRVNDDIEAYFAFSLAQADPPLKRGVKRALKQGFEALHKIVLRPLGIPGAAVLPYLTLAFRKRDVSEGTQDVFD